MRGCGRVISRKREVVGLGERGLRIEILLNWGAAMLRPYLDGQKWLAHLDAIEEEGRA